jgi:hypothetical protein
MLEAHKHAKAGCGDDQNDEEFVLKGSVGEGHHHQNYYLPSAVFSSERSPHRQRQQSDCPSPENLGLRVIDSRPDCLAGTGVLSVAHDMSG